MREKLHRVPKKWDLQHCQLHQQHDFAAQPQFTVRVRYPLLQHEYWL